jgi:hypothetical protein
MSDVQFSRSDVDQLYQKLDTLRPHFTEHEQMLLSAIFAAATEALAPAQPAASAAVSYDVVSDTYVEGKDQGSSGSGAGPGKIGSAPPPDDESGSGPG